MTASPVTRTNPSREDLDRACPAVDQDPVARLDHLGGDGSTDHAGDAVLAADDGRVRQRAAGVADARGDDAERGRPLRRRPAAHEDLARLYQVQVTDRGDHPGRALDGYLRRR